MEKNAENVHKTKPEKQGVSTSNLAGEIIDSIANGTSLSRACLKAGITIDKFYRMIDKDSKQAQTYNRAREIKGDVVADEIIDIADSVEIDPIRARNMIEARKWVASKYHAKVYGDKLDLNVQQAISVNDALAEARSRAFALPILDAVVLPNLSTLNDNDE